MKRPVLKETVFVAIEINEIVCNKSSETFFCNIKISNRL